MFILRSVRKTTSEIQTNIMLGQRYTTVRRGTDKDSFEKIAKDWYGKDHWEAQTQGAFAFISTENDRHLLDNGSDYYIMIENGATFERVVNPAI